MFGKLGDMAKLTKQAMSMKKNMKTMQENLAKQEYTGICEGELVKVVVSGEMIVKSVVVSPNCLHPNGSEMLGALIQSAVNNAIFAAKKSAAEQAEALTQGMDVPGLADMLK